MVKFFVSHFAQNVGLRALTRATLALSIYPWLTHLSLADENEAMIHWGKSFQEKVLPIIEKKCLSCHSGETPDGEFDLSKFPSGETAVAAGDSWDRVAKRVRLNEMPPQGSPGLTDPEKGAFHRWVDSRPNQDLCHQLASDETQSWYRGYVTSRRLSRYEYSCAIRDLTGYHVDNELLPPSDGAGGLGFDTVGDALFTSEIHLEAYLSVALASVESMIARDPSLTSTTMPREEVQVRIARFAKHAWRRPIEAAELDRLMNLYDRTQSIQQPYQAILLSPHFLFVLEPEPESSGVQRLTPHQFATRMALLLWSSVPDEELLTSADRADLFEPEVIRFQMHRMLADERARAIGENFGLQWLGLKDLNLSQPDREVFSDFDPQLTADAIEETVRTVSAVFREGKPLSDLLLSDYVIVNSRLAKHYGIADSLSIDDSLTAGSKATGPITASSLWRTVSVANGQRGGVPTMASVLIKASYPRRTSPVLRGRWILEELLGSKVPPPPPNVPSLEEGGAAATTANLRERLELHRKKSECASCHQRMDPLGFGLENYDALGRWRTEDAGVAIDASGTLPSGESFAGPSELKKLLMMRKDEFQQHAIRKLVGFALGRDLNKFDQCIVDTSSKRLKEENRADVILEEILFSYPFQHRYYSKAKSSP
ncbi:MAG: DUF1592 domain-containing protein [Planctomycetes bacterium]|nr:DUF1592 domain-containing protein [Planctomycetota bacterium]